MGEEVIEIKKSELESLIEKKVAEEINKRDSTHLGDEKESEGNISRREFLKRAGLGTLGLGALLSPVSALSVKDSSFDVFTGTSSSDLTSYLSVGQGGPVNIQNTSLDLNNQDINGVNQINGSDASSLTTLNEVNNNADVPNADYADDADKVDGNHASDFMDSADLSNHSSQNNVHHLAASVPAGDSINQWNRFNSDYSEYMSPMYDGWTQLVSYNLDLSGKTHMYVTVETYDTESRGNNYRMQIDNNTVKTFHASVEFDPGWGTATFVIDVTSYGSVTVNIDGEGNGYTNDDMGVRDILLDEPQTMNQVT